MDNFQKIDKIVNKAGCSYEDAKAALEACGWDMIDAIITLEREGKVVKQAAEQTEAKTDQTIEIIPEVTSDRSDNRNEQNASDPDDGAKESSKRGRNLRNRIRSILINNRMVILRSNGQQIIDLPIVVPVIALLFFFWATLALAVVAMIFGCRFHFEGEDLGKTNINNTMDKATDYAEKVKKDLTGKANGK